MLEGEYEGPEAAEAAKCVESGLESTGQMFKNPDVV